MPASAITMTGDGAALAMAQASEALARRTGARFCLTEAQRRHGVVLRLLRPDDHAGADSAFRRTVATARSQNAKLWELRAACNLARLLVERNRGADGRALLAPLHAWFTEGFDAPDLTEAKALLDRAP